MPSYIGEVCQKILSLKTIALLKEHCFLAPMEKFTWGSIPKLEQILIFDVLIKLS